jgi:hypothetical protein
MCVFISTVPRHYLYLNSIFDPDAINNPRPAVPQPPDSPRDKEMVGNSDAATRPLGRTEAQTKEQPPPASTSEPQEDPEPNGTAGDLHINVL